MRTLLRIFLFLPITTRLPLAFLAPVSTTFILLPDRFIARYSAEICACSRVPQL